MQQITLWDFKAGSELQEALKWARWVLLQL